MQNNKASNADDDDNENLEDDDLPPLEQLDSDQVKKAQV